ncbi:hypothetical protein [uncultured Ramlibacter sp.]|uniref:hypothetical protein n=1 Tax=uncultured Ramlibacter sp. TaxID=260755 RepID=UPI00262BC236|nr:hypothetical protein [uncultured Ramlibacter sp.]
MVRAAWLFLASIACWSPSAFSQPISNLDAGTYTVLVKDGAPTAAYRLSSAGNQWVVEGRIGAEPWRNISCGAGCEYRVSTHAEAESYLPVAERQNLTIACIQNIAQAFCRYNLKAEPSRFGYVVVVLTTSPATPISVFRTQ